MESGLQKRKDSRKDKFVTALFAEVLRQFVDTGRALKLMMGSSATMKWYFSKSTEKGQRGICR